MAIERIKIVINKKTSVVKHQKRDFATLLQENREEKARIRVESIIREDFLIESYSVIELLCELIHERAKYIASQKECPVDLVEAVSSIIWVASRVEIEELNGVRRQLVKKYGSSFASRADKNENDVVNTRLYNKLQVQPPTAHLINRYLEELAKEYHVDWSPTDLGLADPHAPVPTPQVALYKIKFSFNSQ